MNDCNRRKGRLFSCKYPSEHQRWSLHFTEIILLVIATTVLFLPFFWDTLFCLFRHFIDIVFWRCWSIVRLVYILTGLLRTKKLQTQCTVHIRKKQNKKQTKQNKRGLQNVPGKIGFSLLGHSHAYSYVYNVLVPTLMNTVSTSSIHTWNNFSVQSQSSYHICGYQQEQHFWP